MTLQRFESFCGNVMEEKNVSRQIQCPPKLKVVLCEAR